jgi:hypothetical protein
MGKMNTWLRDNYGWQAKKEELRLILFVVAGLIVLAFILAAVIELVG